MTTKLVPTPEQSAALQEAPVVFVDERGIPTHLVLPVDEARLLLDDYYRRELAIAFQQADAGEIEAWDIEATLREAQRRHASRAEE